MASYNPGDLTFPVHSFKMLPKFQSELQPAGEVHAKGVKREKHDRKVSVIALTILAMIAAAGGGALIYFSGGVGNLPLFGSGVGLAALSVGFGIWVAVVIVKASRHIQRANESHVDAAQKKITLPEIFEEMLVSSEDQVLAAVKEFDSDGEFAQFVEFVVERQCFEPKILNAIISRSEELQAIVPGLTDGYAEKMLEILDPDGPELLLQALFDRVGSPDRDKAASFARHPKAFASAVMLNKVNFTAQSFVIQAMDEAQKVEYIRELTDDGVIKVFIGAVVTSDYMRNFDPQSPLFKEIAPYWRAIFDFVAPPPLFLQALYEVMEEKVRLQYVDKMVSLFATKKTLSIGTGELPEAISRPLGVYLDQTPQKFFELKLDDLVLQGEAQCKTVLALLEKHSKLCDSVLSNLDKSAKKGKFIIGYPRYVAMLKVLIQEASQTEKRLSTDRLTLMGQFRSAQQWNKLRKELDGINTNAFLLKTARYTRS